MPIRRLLLILLAVAVTTPVGLYVRQEWRQLRACEREFGSETESSEYEICKAYGSDPAGNCPELERAPFRCSEEYIAGGRKLVAARHNGLYRIRLECAATNPISVGTRCSPEQWDRYCSKYHGGRRELPRCRAAGAEGPEGAPPGELQAAVSAPVGPRSGPQPECGTLTLYEAPGIAPGAVAVDDDGSVWFTEPSIGALSHMTATGKITRRFLPSQPGALTGAPGGDLWFTDRGTNSIWQIRRSGEARRHPIPTATGRVAAASGQAGTGPSDLTVSSDGSVWFVESEADQVGRIRPDGTITELPLFGPKDGYMRPSSITAGPDGSVWVTAGLARRLARVDRRTLAITNFPVSTGGGTVIAHSVAAAPDGGVWFERPSASAMDSRPSAPALGRMNRAGKVTYHPLPGEGPRGPGPLTAGPDGAIWFLDGPAQVVGRVTADGTLTEFPFAAGNVGVGGVGPRQLAAGSNSLWFAQPHANSLGRITCG